MFQRIIMNIWNLYHGSYWRCNGRHWKPLCYLNPIAAHGHSTLLLHYSTIDYCNCGMYVWMYVCIQTHSSITILGDIIYQNITHGQPNRWKMFNHGALGNHAYNFGSANNGNTSNVGTRWRTPTFRALASDRRLLPFDKGTSKPPSPVVPAGGVIGTGAVISVPICKNFSIHEICTETSKSQNFLIDWTTSELKKISLDTYQNHNHLEEFRSNYQINLPRIQIKNLSFSRHAHLQCI